MQATTEKTNFTLQLLKEMGLEEVKSLRIKFLSKPKSKFSNLGFALNLTYLTITGLSSTT